MFRKYRQHFFGILSATPGSTSASFARRIQLRLAGVVLLTTVGIVTTANIAAAQEYEITRSPDGSFAFSILAVNFNEESTLERESILLNASDSPIRLVGASMTIDYGGEGRGRLRYNVASQIEANVFVMALELRHALYDVFGNHMQNLSNTETRNVEPGALSLSGTWNIRQENEVTEHLTTVSFVAQVRLSDGRVWNYNSDALSAALDSLELDQDIDDDPGQN